VPMMDDDKSVGHAGVAIDAEVRDAVISCRVRAVTSSVTGLEAARAFPVSSEQHRQHTCTYALHKATALSAIEQ
jgi:hypothetical protein